MPTVTENTKKLFLNLRPMRNRNEDFVHNNVRVSRASDKITKSKTKESITQAINNNSAKLGSLYMEHLAVTQLHLACLYGNEEIVAAIISQVKHHSGFLDKQSFEGRSALHIAALTGDVNILRLLLLGGANPNVRDYHGNTALHLACVTNSVESVNVLTEPFAEDEKKSNYVPADLEIRNYDGQNCIHLAAQTGHMAIMRTLLKAGANINAREGKAGRTALHIALEMDNKDVISFILQKYLAKVNFKVTTYAGYNVYETALLLNKPELLKVHKTNETTSDVNT